MAKAYGVIGYAEGGVETAPGVFRDIIVEKPYQGDLVRNSRQLRDGEYQNDDLTVSNSISIVADAYAADHFFAIRYIVWSGAAWVVSDVDASTPPRLLLRLGGVYNGRRASAETAPTP